MPAAATAASQAQLLSPTGQLQAVHQPAAAVQTQQALQQDPNDPNKWHVVQVATAAAPQPAAAAAPIATAQLVTAAPAASVASVVASADDSIAAASSTTDVKPSHGGTGAGGKTRLRRVACTCPNCKDGDRSRSKNNPDGKPRKKQHICHMDNCNKVSVGNSAVNRRAVKQFHQ